MSKQNLKFLSSFINSLGSREYYPRRWRPGRRKTGFSRMNNGFNFYINNPPAYRKNLQIMGSGATTAYFECQYKINAYDTSIQLQTIFNQTEFRTKALEWTYMKIENVYLHLPPVSSNHEFYILMLWTNDDNSRDNVLYSDSTKKISTHAVKIQKLVWKPPNATLPTGNTLGMSTVNLRDWIVIDDLAVNTQGVNTYYIPGQLAIYFPDASGGSGDDITITVKVRFRGSKYPSVPGILSNLLTRKELNDKEKEIIKQISESHNIIKEKPKDEEIPKPLFYNSNNAITFKSKSVEKQPGLFNFKIPENSIFGNK